MLACFRGCGSNLFPLRRRLFSFSPSSSSKSELTQAKGQENAPLHVFPFLSFSINKIAPTTINPSCDFSLFKAGASRQPA
jgi:hypothetical protein